MTHLLGLSPADYLRALECKRVVIGAETVRERFMFFGHIGEWITVTDGSAADRERLVPGYVPELKAECRMCAGHGCFDAGPDATPCPTCGGSGSVSRFLLGTEQWQIVDRPNAAWHLSGPRYDLLGDLPTGRRFAGLALAGGVTVLPVVDTVPLGQCVYLGQNGTVWLSVDAGRTNVTDELWAADLRPGDIVLRFESVETLAEPVTDVPCDNHDDDGEPCDRRVPLQVSPGEWVEL